MLCARRRDLHPRHQIRTHTVHTFGSSGHDVTRFVPRDLLESPGPAAYPTLEYDTLVPFFEFLNVAVDSGWPDCTEIFIRSFYPDKHDAFQMGYWLMFMAGAYLRKDEMSADKQDSGLVRRVLLIANALLNPQPFLRITVQEARAALFQALHKLGSN